MCGRYAASANPDELIEAFEIDVDASAEPSRSVLVNPQQPPVGEPDYNMAPTKQAPVVLTRAPRAAREGTEPGEAVRQLRHLTWGLVPSWSRDVKAGVRMINARSETLLTSRAYASAARSRRCLVPARGWYEWQASPVATDAKGKPRKQPFFISDPEEPIIAFAGLYEFWRDRTVADSADPMAWLTTFTIITTDADPGLDRIHDRQPLVLEPADWSTWLDPALTDESDIADLLAFSRPGRFTAYPVSRAVSSNRSNGPHLIDPVAADELVGVVDPETGEIIGG
ncbi:MAG TPA: SOS response-associated peptidase [Intrasporangiaceae bacterium]|nr:SOS response-associated peptidase [Intrasporangiaceae bacterium]